MPGRYLGKHRSPDSCFIDGDTIDLFHRAFKRHIPRFDLFGYVEVPKEDWRPVLRELSVMRVALYPTKPALAKLIQDLEAWIDDTLKTNEIISFLGI